MSRRRTIALAAASATVLVVAGGLVVTLGDSDPSAAQSDEATLGAPTAPVTRRDLEEREAVDGTLGYGDQHEIGFGRQGTITGLADEGEVVERGGILGEVDGEPVVLLYGARPQWRSLGYGADTADGPDILQLEENLVALGFAAAEDVGPDEDWTWATSAAVKDWQESLGKERTGVVQMGDVVYAGAPLRIGGHVAELGDDGGGPALAVTGTERYVDIALAADEGDLLSVGQAVDVELPDGAVVGASVRSVATVVEVDAQSGEATVDVVVALDDDADAGVLDEAPVDVQIVTVEAAGVLTVPVEALLALAEGGYAVERPGGELVGVQLGTFADGFVEITPTTAELVEGDEVVVPA